MRCWAAAVLALGAYASSRAAPAGEVSQAISEDFERGLCTDRCPGAHWAWRQQVRGTLRVEAGALNARAGARIGKAVGKAALVARPAPMRAGTQLRIGFDLLVPRGRPINSLQLVDIECATCGIDGNPGVRLYLRHGRLRIDRSKIGVRHAWSDDTAPAIVAGRWHRVELDLLLHADARGSATVRLDNAIVLVGSGLTLHPGGRAQADRIQIGITANSNPIAAHARFDNIAIVALPPKR